MLVMPPSVPGCAAAPSPADCMLAHPATTSRTSGVQKFTVFRIARLRLTVESEGGQGNSQLFARWPTLRAAEDSASWAGKRPNSAITSNGTFIVAVKFLNETPTAPKYDPIAPASRD